MQAGPNLSAKTFAGGMFRLPARRRRAHRPAGLATGSTACSTTPTTRRSTTSPMVYWDPDAKGPDEQNKDGKGMWRYVDGGKRFLLGDIESIDLVKARDPPTAPTLLDEVPEEDRVPDYPPWPGSPAAAGGG